MPWRAVWVLGIAAAAAALTALLLWRYPVDDQAAIRLTPVSYTDIEGWARDDHGAALGALRRSCRKRTKSNPACGEILKLGDDIDRETARRFFESHYVPHRVEGEEPGLVTGYYEPEVAGSRERKSETQVPVYGRPDDLVQVTPDELRALYNASFTVGRRSGDALVPNGSTAPNHATAEWKFAPCGARVSSSRSISESNRSWMVAGSSRATESVMRDS